MAAPSSSPRKRKRPQASLPVSGGAGSQTGVSFGSRAGGVTAMLSSGDAALLRGLRYVTPSLAVQASAGNAPLDWQARKKVKGEVHRVLEVRWPLLNMIANTSIEYTDAGCLQGVHVSVKDQHQRNIFQHRCGNGDYVLIRLSDKFESFAVLTVASLTNPARTRANNIINLDATHLPELRTSLHKFAKQFRIADGHPAKLSYYYTSRKERQSTDQQFDNRRGSSGGGRNSRFKPHSSCFHLKIRVPSAFYKNMLPIMQLVGFSRLREEVEPIRYGNNRTLMTYDDVFALFEEECGGSNSSKNHKNNSNSSSSSSSSSSGGAGA